MKLTIHAMAALLMAGAALTACSGDDDLFDMQAIESTPQTGTYTLSVETAKGISAIPLPSEGRGMGPPMPSASPTSRPS